jgi:hypothetical protein
MGRIFQVVYGGLGFDLYYQLSGGWLEWRLGGWRQAHGAD